MFCVMCSLVFVIARLVLYVYCMIWPFLCFCFCFCVQCFWYFVCIVWGCIILVIVIISVCHFVLFLCAPCCLVFVITYILVLLCFLVPFEIMSAKLCVLFRYEFQYCYCIDYRVYAVCWILLFF